MKIRALRHSFVKFIPETLDDGVLYVSIDYCTAAHNCVCGCGNKVVTPLTLTDWELTFNGETVSLNPSIGNWSFDCQSHYWVKRGEIQWAGKWSQEEIDTGREKDHLAKQIYFKDEKESSESCAKNEITTIGQKTVIGFWQKLRQRFRL